MTRTCSIDDCDAPHHARGWCTTHYSRWKSHGDPLVKKTAAPGELLEYVLAVLTTMPGCTAGQWPYVTSRGRCQMKVDGRRTYAHQLVCEWYHGDKPFPDAEVRHLCGKGHLGCFSPCCVVWGSRLDNAHDRDLHGTTLRGEDSPNALITKAIADEIRSRYRGSQRNVRPPVGLTQDQLAVEYGISQSLVSLIIQGRIW